MRRAVCTATILAAGVLACGGAPAAREPSTNHFPRAAERPAIELDTDGVEQFLRWIDGPRGAALEWRNLRVFAVTREWSKGSAVSDPDVDIQRQLDEVSSAGPTDERVPRARRLLSGIVSRRGEFVATAPGYLSPYLPAGTPIRGRIVFGVMLPGYAFSDGENICISLTSKHWADNAEMVLNTLVHELYHNGFATHRKPRSVIDVAGAEAATSNIEWQIQNEGMATYVGYRARPPTIARDARSVGHPAIAR